MAAAVVTAEDTWGGTIGNGLAQVPICGSARAPQVVVNHTLAPGETHGVMHHFWATGAPTKIDQMHVEYWIDGEATPSISFQPSMMCGFAFPEHIPHNKEYSAGGLCGKTAPVGGWWNTFPIPFYKSVVVTVRADFEGTDCFGGYVNIRGTAGLPLVLPGSSLPLPIGSRMVLQRNELAVRQPLEYVTVAELPAGSRGMVFQTTWAVETQPTGGASAGGGYIEGCWTFYRAHNESFPGLVVGTGVEDYFDSGYYFGADSGEPVGIPFANPLSGLTLHDRSGDGGATERISAYRFHNRDPLVMADGGRLVWRVGAQGGQGTTKCGNPIPTNGSPTSSGSSGYGGYGGFSEEDLAEMGLLPRTPPLGRELIAVNLTTYAWVYTFTPGSTPPPLPTPTPAGPTPPPPTPPPPAPSPDSGCSKGSCDALCALKNVRGCAASWAGGAAMSAPPTGHACGGAATCDVPADACGAGWHICLSASAGTSANSVAKFAADLDVNTCAGGVGGSFFGGMSHAAANKTCVTGTDNGCHGGWGGEPFCCGDGCRLPSCPDGVWKGGTRIVIGDGAGGVCDNFALSQRRDQGVLCCRS